MSAIAAVILAGGRSSRMGGGDKALLELAGSPMLAVVIDRLGLPANDLAINANGDPARLASFGLPVLADAQQTFDGPLAGILASIRWAAGNGFERVLTVAGDTPFFPLELATRLGQAAPASTIAVAASRGRMHPTFALWPTCLADDLVDQLDRDVRRVASFIARHPSVEIDFPDMLLDGEAIDPFFNVNTPQDLAEAQRIANKLGS
jgi:molybdopterin-guanine dinucleotide biosynthesis protein A